MELAWAAGFFDGEGSTTVKKSAWKTPSLRLSLANTHRPNIERFCDAVGMPRRVYEWKYDNQKWKLRYSIEFASTADVEKILFNLWPYLGSEKRGQAMASIKVAREYPSTRIVKFDFQLLANEGYLV